MTANAHRALYSASGDDNFLANLTVDDDDESLLRDARDLIRETLKNGFRNWSDFIERRILFENVAIASVDRFLRPKFKMQGSWSYFTLNRTTVDPPQEIDLDDGMFLPVSFLGNQGRVSPAIVSDGYFAAVEKMLAPLCDEHGWELNPTPLKSSCVRVRIKPGAHIDIALYAIPDEEFEELLEKAAARAIASFGASRDEHAMFADQVYRQLPSDQIMLAHREEGWKPSDPRKLEDWFNEAVHEHGYQLRRVCRYLKGWRDNRWDACRLSSIALMACAVQAYDEAIAAPPESRDDLALQMVAEALPALLSARIVNPVVAGQYLDEGWEPDLRNEFVSAARGLADALRAVVNATSNDDAIDDLSEALGPYIPDDANLIAIEAIGAPAILTSGMLGDGGPAPEDRAPVKIGGDDRYG